MIIQHLSVHLNEILMMDLNFSKLIIKLLKSFMDVVNKVIFSFIPSLTKLDLLVFMGSLEVP